MDNSEASNENQNPNKEKLETRDTEESQIEERPEELPEHEENPGIQKIDEED